LGPLCPKRLFALNEFPRTPTGKIVREQLAAQLAASPLATSG